MGSLTGIQPHAARAEPVPAEGTVDSGLRVWRALLTTVCVWVVLSRVVVGQLSSAGLQRLQRATVLIESGADRCSGVLISEAGLIATAAHGVHEDAGRLRVRLWDGRQFPAVELIRDVAADTALLRLQDAADVIVLPVAAAVGQLPAGESVFACGFPAREVIGSPAVVRAGEVRKAAGGVVRTTCQLTVGDSGGPLVNGAGYLVGLHRQIGAGPESNMHTSVDVLWRLLRRTGLQTEVAAVENAEPIDPGGAIGGLSEQYLRGLSSSLLEIRVLSAAVGSEGEKLIGVVISGTQLAVRLSAVEVEQRYGVLQAGLLRELRLQRQSESLDLAIFEMAEEGDVEGLQPIRWREDPAVIFERVQSLSPGDSGAGMQLSSAGVISRVGWNEPRVRAVLGVDLEEVETSAGRGLRVQQTTPNGPAAGRLFGGDILVGVGNEQIGTREQFGRLLGRLQPGHRLRLELR
ncbi:MAG TPA: hypothetical protein DCR20_00100, partial [Planctomycetaceae bacterium]|nr:hypothetical protein [Planctomycetaceae bacterium]